MGVWVGELKNLQSGYAQHARGGARGWGKGGPRRCRTCKAVGQRGVGPETFSLDTPSTPEEVRPGEGFALTPAAPVEPAFFCLLHCRLLPPTNAEQRATIPPSPLQLLLTQFSFAYIIADFIFYLMPFTPNDYVFIVHHFISGFYVVG